MSPPGEENGSWSQVGWIQTPVLDLVPESCPGMISAEYYDSQRGLVYTLWVIQCLVSHENPELPELGGKQTEQGR